MADKLQNFIDGHFVPAHGEKTLDIVDPATGRTVAVSPVSDQQDVDAAFEAASVASRTWKKTTPAERQEALLQLADLHPAEGGARFLPLGRRAVLVGVPDPPGRRKGRQRGCGQRGGEGWLRGAHGMGRAPTEGRAGAGTAPAAREPRGVLGAMGTGSSGGAASAAWQRGGEEETPSRPQLHQGHVVQLKM